MDNLTKKIIANRLKAIAYELQEITEILKEDKDFCIPSTKETYEEIIGIRGPRGNIDLDMGTPGEDYNKGGLGDSQDLPGEDSVIAKAQEPNPDSIQGYRKAFSEKENIKKLDPRYPVLNDENYNDALFEINKTKWKSDSVKDYRRYNYLKGSIINTMRINGRTSVPLDKSEPNWDSKVIEEYNNQQSI